MRRWDPSLLGDGEQADGDAYPMDVGSGPLSDNDDDDDGTACASASPNGVPAPVRRSGQWGLCGFRVPNVKFAVMCVYSVWSLAVCCFAPLSLSCFRATAPGEWLDQRSLDPVSCFMVQVRLSHMGVDRAHVQVRLDLDGLDAVDVFAQLASQQVHRRWICRRRLGWMIRITAVGI